MASSACALTWDALNALAARRRGMQALASAPWPGTLGCEVTGPACCVGSWQRPARSQRHSSLCCALATRIARLPYSPEHFIFASHASHGAARFTCGGQRKLAWRDKSHAGLVRERALGFRARGARSEGGLRVRGSLAGLRRLATVERYKSGPGRHNAARTMQLLVRTLSGRTVAIQADATERVSAFKARVVGGPTEAVRLTHAGHELGDARTLGELQLGHGAVIQAALRFNGGVMTSVKLVTPRHASKSVTVSRAAQPHARVSTYSCPELTTRTPRCAD